MVLTSRVDSLLAHLPALEGTMMLKFLLMNCWNLYCSVPGAGLVTLSIDLESDALTPEAVPPKPKSRRFILTCTGVPGAAPIRVRRASPLRKLAIYVSA